MSFGMRFKTEADRLGFSLSGITHPSTPDHYDIYLDWIDHRYHASMTYLSNDEAIKARSQPSQLLPDCKTVLLLGYPYPLFTSNYQESHHYPIGKISAYALIEDYHLVILQKITELAHWIQQEINHPISWRCYTDTGPILERDLAYRAGLGWIGKNSCLISKHFGSHFFIAEIFLDYFIDLDIINASKDHCGNCHKCIEQCPTKCILPNRTIDSSRCISFLTIENKGAIPIGLRQYIGNWIFGCDICQLVCPWNLKHIEKTNTGDIPDINQDLLLPNLNYEILLQPEEFEQKYKNHAIMRAKRKGYLRNVAVALGNLKYESSIEVLVYVLENETEPLIRSHVAWALGQFKTPYTISILKKVYFLETDFNVKSEILSALND